MPMFIVINSISFLYTVTYTHTWSCLLTSTCSLTHTEILSQSESFLFCFVCVHWPKTLKVLANIWRWCNTGLPEQTPLVTQCWGFNWHKLCAAKASELFRSHFLCLKDLLTLKHQKQPLTTETHYFGLKAVFLVRGFQGATIKFSSP